LNVDTDFAFQRYQAIALRLPAASYPQIAQRVSGLLEIADEFDAFLFDAFGVLNVGNAGIPGAPETVRTLQANGKHTLVVTNAGSVDKRELMKKYLRLGFDFSDEQVVSSRGQMLVALQSYPDTTHWGVAAFASAGLEYIDARLSLLEQDSQIYESVDGIILLSSHDWNAARQELLVNSIAARPRPVLVGNPDIIAPRERGFSLEPGFYAHDLADRTGVEPEFYGKPFGHVFAEAGRRIGVLDQARVLMLGDTLHTDILGGAAAGFKTALVADHGLFRGHDVDDYIAASGIVPDFILPSI